MTQAGNVSTVTWGSGRGGGGAPQRHSWRHPLLQQGCSHSSPRASGRVQTADTIVPLPSSGGSNSRAPLLGLLGPTS